MSMSRMVARNIKLAPETSRSLDKVASALGMPFWQVVDIILGLSCDRLEEINQKIPEELLRERVKAVVAEVVPDGDRLSPSALSVRLKISNLEIRMKRKTLCADSFIAWTQTLDPDGYGWSFNQYKLGYERVANDKEAG